MRTKSFRAPWNYQINLLFRSDFCFVFIYDESVTSILDKNTGKAFIHVTTIYFLVTILLFKVFNMLQAFLFSFFFCTLGQPIRAQVSCSLAGPT